MRDRIEVYGTSQHITYVDPRDVVTQLFRKYSMNDNAWVVKEDGKYYIRWEAHKYRNEEKEIDERLYNFLNSLEVVNDFLLSETINK